jgi:hypothetical protein
MLIGGVCVAGTLESWCKGSSQACPSQSELLESLRGSPSSDFFELPCQAADGSPRVLINANELYRSIAYRFDLAGVLVGTGIVYFEGGSACGEAYGTYYGETGGDCRVSRDRPIGCPQRDAGADHYECVLTDAGSGG